MITEGFHHKLIDLNFFQKIVLISLQSVQKIVQLQGKNKNILRMDNELSSSVILKKDLFIASRQDDIRKYYQFFPKFLGRGAYGVVYKAKMINPPHSLRAVKIIPKILLKNPQSLINQVKILKKMDHPSIIKLYQTFEDRDHCYLVLDYCQGGELFNRLSEHGKFSEENARNLFMQIMKILKYMHSQRIAHRDLKPQNFLMYSQNSFDLKIIDFGFSYQYESDMKSELKSRNLNKIFGTSYYIAPQVIGLDYDQRCDIWSAGVILYILVTATAPFDGKNDMEIMQNVMKNNYSLETPQACKLSENLKDLIRRIFVPDSLRITIDQIFSHSWMTAKLPQQSLQLNFKKLKQFSNFSKLKTIAVTYIASQLPQKEIHQLGEIFKQIDENNDGYLTIEELEKALQRQQENASLKELNNILQTIDTDRNGSINYNQFVACCLQNSIMNNETYLSHAFHTFDKDNSGTISKKQFKDILSASNLANELLVSFIDEIMRDCDKDKDGEINYGEFLESVGFNKQQSHHSEGVQSTVSSTSR